MIVWTKQECEDYRSSIRIAHQLLPQDSLQDDPSLLEWSQGIRQEPLLLYRPTGRAYAYDKSDPMERAFLKISLLFSNQPVSSDRIRATLQKSSHEWLETQSEAVDSDALVREMLRLSLLEYIIVKY